MSTHHTLERTTNEFFTKFTKCKDTTLLAYEYIRNTANDALNRKDHHALLELISYMESGEGYYAFRYIGEARRIFRILNIISLENKFQKVPFCHDCASLETLMDKYVMVLFALRRLIFQLSDSSIDEALFFLHNKRISPFAIYVLTKDELIIPNTNLYKTILRLYKDIWSDDDVQQFIALINSSNNK